jgi:ectoine hydroxylase-related dioxygenase (phytanoyl-CoA dioxygenase family)
MITVLFFIDEVAEHNGPLEVVPGSHTGPLHWHNSIYTGTVSDSLVAEMKPRAIPCLARLDLHA